MHLHHLIVGTLLLTTFSGCLDTGSSGSQEDPRWPELQAGATITYLVEGSDGLEIAIEFLEPEEARRSDGSTAWTYPLKVTGDFESIVYKFSTDWQELVSAFEPEATRGSTDIPINQETFAKPHTRVWNLRPSGILAFIPILGTGLKEPPSFVGNATRSTESNGQFIIETPISDITLTYRNRPFPDRIDVLRKDELSTYSLHDFESGTGANLTARPTPKLSPLDRPLRLEEADAPPSTRIIRPPIFDLDQEAYNLSEALVAAYRHPDYLQLATDHDAVFLYEVHRTQDTWRYVDEDDDAYDPVGLGIFEARWRFFFAGVPTPAGSFHEETAYVQVNEYRSMAGSVFFAESIGDSPFFFSARGLSGPPDARFADLDQAIRIFSDLFPHEHLKTIKWVATDLSTSDGDQEAYAVLTSACPSRSSTWHLAVVDLYTGLLHAATGDDGGACTWTNGTPW